MKIIIKQIFIPILLFLIFINSKADQSVSINLVKNLYAYNVLICDKNKCREISPNRDVKLENNFKIPYVSIKNYLEKFTKNKPFKPDNALQVKANNKKFYIWANESGIMCAPDPEKLENLENWTTQNLFDVLKNYPKSQTNIALKFLLLIDKSGSLSLKAC